MANKVVYNACYGGFSISLKCLKYMHENGGLSEEEYEKYLRVIDCWAEVGSKDYWIAYVILKDGNRRWVECRKDRFTEDEFVANLNIMDNIDLWYIRSKENVWKHINVFNKIIDIFYEGSRHNKILVEAVETLGSQECSGSCAELKVKELPEGTRIYKISDYDGKETVEILDDEDIYIID